MGDDACELPKAIDTFSDIGGSPGACYLILVARELTGMSQRSLATAIAISQPALARLETGDQMPSVRRRRRVSDATGLELVLGGLVDLAILREPSVFKGPPDR